MRHDATPPCSVSTYNDGCAGQIGNRTMQSLACWPCMVASAGNLKHIIVCSIPRFFCTSFSPCWECSQPVPAKSRVVLKLQFPDGVCQQTKSIRQIVSQTAFSDVLMVLRCKEGGIVCFLWGLLVGLCRLRFSSFVSSRHWAVEALDPGTSNLKGLLSFAFISFIPHLLVTSLLHYQSQIRTEIRMP